MSWTLEELARRAADALADADVRSSNGRVTPLPDRRVIRWYATIGLVDRPLSSQGRTARYGPRHLLQLVAIKRRQADGRTLAEIQAELAGATDATLSEIARLPADRLTEIGAATEDRERRRQFWTVAPAPPVAVTVESALRPAPAAKGPPVEAPLSGVRLWDVVLLVPGRPDEADLAAIRAAAQPLLDVLVHRGLMAAPEGSPR
jgi:DNA-binding transcriptional MerR regulator